MRNSKSPSIYSIYQNALPFYSDRADLLNVDQREASFAHSFLNELLRGKLTLQLDASSFSADKMRHIYFESRNYERTAGPKTVGFGYPLLIDSFEGELLVAPVFIWQLSIEAAQTKMDSWVLKFPEGGHILTNHHLLSHLKKKFDLDWEEKLNELSHGNKLNASTLGQACKELVEALQLDEVSNEAKLVQTPGIDVIGNLTEKGTLHWSGVIGLYPPQYKNSILQGLKPEDVFVVESTKDTEEDKMVFPFIPCDPEQMTAIELVERNKLSVVEGVDDLGKTQTVLNLLINALANGEKCLVVSERAQALKKTQDLLTKSGLSQFHFLLDDELNDKIPLLELLKVMAGGIDMYDSFDETSFAKKKDDFIEVANKLQHSYTSVKKPIFGKNNWTDVVGLFLESQKKEGKEFLATDLNASDFDFNIEEHGRIVNHLNNCRPSFEKVGTLSHPLTKLHNRFFEGGQAEEELDKVQSILDKYLQQGKELQHSYLNGIDGYSAALKNYYLFEYRQLESAFVSLANKMGSYQNELGEAFSKAGSGGLNLGLIFSSKKKKIAKAQKDVSKSYMTLLKDFNKNRFFEFEPEPDKNGNHIAKLQGNLERFKKALRAWKDKIDARVQEETNRLNSKTAHPALDVKEQVTSLEYSLELYIEELNEAGLFKTPLENKTLTVPQRQKYLESILESLRATQLNLRDFPHFHEWQSKWLALSDLEKKVVQTLIKVKPRDWQAAFESWYFHNILTLSESPNLPSDQSSIDAYNEQWHLLKPLIIKKIQYYWKKQQQSSIKQFKRKRKKSYQLIFSKSKSTELNQLPLSKILSENFDVVSDFLPLMFVTPNVALNIIPDDFKYDFILFEESNRFSVEMATALTGKGKRVAIFGSDDNNGNETSLLQYALESGVPSAKITNIYQAPTIKSLGNGSNPLFDFANEYFIDEIEGRFHEVEGTNDAEAQHIIRLLNQIKQTPQRVYPTVGIVAFTVEQRDLIASYLLKLKQQNSAASEKIRQLERNGLGVYFSEEIFGQQFDVLILSATFGAVNLKGELTKKLLFLNTPEGQSHLHLMINKQVQKFFIVHSFSEEMLETFRGKKYETGTWLLSHFIQMAEAYKNGNEFLLEESLEAIGKKERRELEKSPFSIQLKQQLSPYFNEELFSISVEKVDVLLPLLIGGEGSAKGTILASDVFLADTAYTSGVWEYNRIEGLKEMGYEYITVSSLDWFKNNTLESRKLASQLLKLQKRNSVDDLPNTETTEEDEVNDDKENLNIDV